MFNLMLNKKMRILSLFLVFIVFSISCSPKNKKQAVEKPFSFGIVADIQYGDKQTKGSRHYRSSIDNLKKCVHELNDQDLVFTIQLGDIIDGNESSEKTLEDLEQILHVYNQLNMSKFHVVGNHCLTAGKDILADRMGLNTFYYDFTIPESKKWRFIVLDGNDAGYGVLETVQLDWLESKLAAAREQGERVIVFNHFPLLEAAAEKHRMKIPEPVLKRIEASGCVAAYFAGHDHAGGYHFSNGIHHITMEGMVEAPSQSAFGIIEVYPDKLVINGHGKTVSRELVLPEALIGR